MIPTGIFSVDIGSYLQELRESVKNKPELMRPRTDEEMQNRRFALRHLGLLYLQVNYIVDCEQRFLIALQAKVRELKANKLHKTT